jgi:carbohydrate-selective porin OprB
VDPRRAASSVVVPDALDESCGTRQADWGLGGLRSVLETQGVEIGFANYGDTIGVVSGDATRQLLYADLLEPTVAVSLEKLVCWRNGRFFFTRRLEHLGYRVSLQPITAP